MPARYLPIYLNDHLAGATLGVELARRTRGENADELGEFLDWLVDQVVEDRAALLSLMRRLGVTPSRGKVAGAWAAEKIGRLKPNGRVSGYSPLSRLVELEGLASGIEGKRSLWLALLEVVAVDARLDREELELLAERAREQRDRLEPHRLAAVRTALG
jgi:hypothetical protein